MKRMKREKQTSEIQSKTKTRIKKKKKKSKSLDVPPPHIKITDVRRWYCGTRKVNFFIWAAMYSRRTSVAHVPSPHNGRTDAVPFFRFGTAAVRKTRLMYRCCTVPFLQ
jgi:hypothetical protein